MTNDTLDEFVVVVSHDGRMQALDARDGRARWTQTRGHRFAGFALAQVGHEAVAVSLDGYVCVLALDDGTVRPLVSSGTCSARTAASARPCRRRHPIGAAEPPGALVHQLEHPGELPLVEKRAGQHRPGGAPGT